MESHRLGSSVPTAQNVTVDEVVSAYKQACQKLSCRQIPKLLRQLQVCCAAGREGWCPPSEGEGLLK